MWDITSEQTNYDFNPWRESDHGSGFRTVANMYDDWQDEIKFANTQQYDFYWTSPTKPEGDTYSYEYEELLCKDWGIPLDFVNYKQWIVTEECPILFSMAEKVGLVGGQTNLQTQHTGNMLHLHIDTLTGLRKERKDRHKRVFFLFQNPKLISFFLSSCIVLGEETCLSHHHFSLCRSKSNHPRQRRRRRRRRRRSPAAQRVLQKKKQEEESGTSPHHRLVHRKKNRANQNIF